MKILIPAEYTIEYEQLTLRYLRLGRLALTFAEWKMLFTAFDLLHRAVVEVNESAMSFRAVYQDHVDRPFADQYIHALLQLVNVTQEHDRLRAQFARQIWRRLQAIAFYDPNVAVSNLLVAYCLYFWEAFAMGYAFEVEIFRDLRASGIEFSAHDLRDRQARLSAYDLMVLNLYGDIKNTLYFLQVRRSQHLPHDFYITRFYAGQRRYTLIVMVQLAAWETIDGDTIDGLLDEAIRYFPQPVQVTLDSGKVVVVDYAIWKAKILRQQGKLRPDV